MTEIEQDFSLPEFPSMPEISQYTDYRRFLMDFFHYKKHSRPLFSFRAFSAAAGLKSPNYIQLVIQKKRNLTVDTAANISRFMKLSPAQCLYFEALVREEASQGETERQRARQDLHRALKELKTTQLRKEQAGIFCEWYYLPVRELTFLADFRPEASYVVSRLGSLITVEQARLALQFLEQNSYIEIIDGRWKARDPILDSGDQIFAGELMQEYHSRILALWSRHLRELGTRNQELGLLNLPIPESVLPELRFRIRQFQDEIIGWLQDVDSKECRRFVQLGTYLMCFSGDESEI